MPDDFCFSSLLRRELLGFCLFEVITRINLPAKIAAVYSEGSEGRTMPVKDFFCIIILSVVTGFLLIRFVMERHGRGERAAGWNEESLSTSAERRQKYNPNRFRAELLTYGRSSEEKNLLWKIIMTHGTI